MDPFVPALAAFAFGFLGSMPLTGPVAVLVFSASLQHQPGVAVRVGLGAALAEALYAALAFWGFTTFLARHPFVLPLSHGVSALVLGGLGVYFARWSPGEPGPARPEPERGRKGFLLGFSISALNPTLLATWSAAVAFLYSRSLVSPAPLGALPFGVAAGAGVAGWEVLFVALLRRHERRLPRGALVWGVRGMGVLLLGVAVFSGMDFARSFHR